MSTPQAPAASRVGSPGKGLAISAMVVGAVGCIVGFVAVTSAFTYQYFIIVTPLALIALSLAFAALVKARRHGTTQAFAWGGVGAGGLAATLALIAGLLFASLMSSLNQFEQQMSGAGSGVPNAPANNFEPPAQPPAPSIQEATLGETLTYQGQFGGGLKVTLSDVEVVEEIVDDSYGYREITEPVNGVFVTVRMAIVNKTGQTAPVDKYGMRYLIGDEQYMEGAGNAYMAPSDELFQPKTLNPGEREDGLLYFDVPEASGQFVHTDDMDRIDIKWSKK